MASGQKRLMDLIMKLIQVHSPRGLTMSFSARQWSSSDVQCHLSLLGLHYLSIDRPALADAALVHDVAEIDSKSRAEHPDRFQ